jgi:DNA repair protein RecO (recombination protein O)
MDYAYLECTLLSEAGYGIDLRTCAVTGRTDDLIYVSPKSGKAVSALAGERYKDKLLKLPCCALTMSEPSDLFEFRQMADLLLYFFQRYIFKKDEPPARSNFIEHMESKFISSLA